MRYSIIGAGKVGTALAHQFFRAKLPVAIANTRAPDSLGELTASLGGVVRATSLADALDAEVIFLALPFMAVEHLGARRADWAGKIVIDATNAFGASPEYLAGRLSSQVVAAAFPGATVVKAFNQLPAAVLARSPAQDGGRRVVFIAGNDEGANETVKAMSEQLGFAPIVLGRIDEGGRLLNVPGPLILHNLVEHPFG